MFRSPAQNPHSLKLPTPGVRFISHEYCQSKLQYKTLWWWTPQIIWRDPEEILPSLFFKTFCCVQTTFILTRRKIETYLGNLQAAKFCINLLIINARSRDNEEGVAARLRARGSGVRMPVEARYFFPLQNVLIHLPPVQRYRVLGKWATWRTNSFL